MNKHRLSILFLILFTVVITHAQKLDSLQILDEFTFKEKKKENSIENSYLKNVENYAIYAGKKTDLIKIDQLIDIKSRNIGRQIFGKVAGINIVESDASGLQLDISTRGLDPSRSASFNIRQNGYDMSADALGYPDAYYVPPTDAVDRIEIVRGAASLQYGTQFGGLINFKLKDGAKSTKPYHITLNQTAGLYGFFNSYNALHGKHKKLNYYTFYQYRRGDGWRPNSNFHSHNAYIHLEYEASEKVKIRGQYTFMQYLAQQAGGLTDNQFNEDPFQSRRARNFFGVNWNLISLGLDYKITSKSQISTQFFSLIAGRDAIGNLNNIQQIDAEGSARNFFNDDYKNFGNETKWMHKYSTNSKNSFVLLLGSRIYRGLTFKRNDLGDNSNLPKFQFLESDLQSGSEFQFPSLNAAIFGEHLFSFNKFSITPGFRYEYILTEGDGKYRNQTIFNDIVLQDTTIFENIQRGRSVFLAGLGLSYKPTSGFELIANFSQNYRAINFNDIRVFIPGLRVDENIQDEKGYSFDFGFRGNYKNIVNYNSSFYYMSYNNRISEVLTVDSVTFAVYRFRTNIAQSRTIGVDVSTEIDFLQIKENPKDDISLKLFLNSSIMNAEYIKSSNKSIEGNKVEYAPSFIFRTGLNFNYKNFVTGIQFNYVSSQFSEATNSVDPTPNAVAGIIPSYYVMDFSMSYSLKWFTLKTNINNITNNKYFTRRTGGYPGPGILPAEPINFLSSLIFEL